MALPVSPGPPSDDVAILGWAGITARVGWTLLKSGIKVRPEVLADARRHALYYVPRSASQAHAEDIAGTHTARFVARARSATLSPEWMQDHSMPLSPRWRRTLERAMDPLARAVFRKHYGDNRSLPQLEQQLGVDAVTIEAVRGGLREVIQRAAAADGVALHWSAARLDRLLTRLAAWAEGPCPPLLDIVEGAHRSHVAGCVRCDRIVRLVRASVLTVEDLLPPSLRGRPEETVRVLALHLHPDARRHRAAIRDELPVPAYPLGDDVLLVDGAHAVEVGLVLSRLGRLAAPARDHIRGALVQGLGDWSAHGLLGPLAREAEREARYRTWGTVDGVGELPPPLPEPPAARSAWVGVGVLCAALAAAVRLAVASPAPGVAYPLDVEFSPGRGGVWTAFDVDDRALVAVVRTDGDTLQQVGPADSPADKALWAVGDGTFRLHTTGAGVAVVSSPQALPELDAWLAAASGTADPLDALAERIEGAVAGADVRVFTP